MRGRPTVEVVLLILTGVVAVILVASALAILVVEVRDPTADTSALTQVVLTLTSSIVSGLLGVIAGRRLGRGDPP